MSENNQIEIKYDYKQLFKQAKKYFDCSMCPDEWHKRCMERMNLPCESDPYFWEEIFNKGEQNGN